MRPLILSYKDMNSKVKLTA